MNCANAKNERLLIFDENNRQHAKAEGRIIIAKRLVFHVGGYDPITPAGSARRRFVRELARFERTWSVEASIGALQETPTQAKWSVITRGPNWCVESDYRLIRWDDVIEKFSGQSIWRRIPFGIIALIDFIWAGALRGYLRTNWHYAIFFLYPFVMFGFFIAAACVTGAYAFHRSDSIVLAAAACLCVLSALLLGPWRWLRLDTLFDDWIFARDYIRSGNSNIEKRL